MCLRRSCSSYTAHVLTTLYVGEISPAPFRRPRRLEARTVIQQCSNAKVKTKPALDGADAQWAEVGVFLYPFVLLFICLK